MGILWIRRRPRFRVSTLVVALCLATLCLADISAVTTAWTGVTRLVGGQVPSELELERQQETLRSELVGSVPSGSTITLSDDSQTGWGGQRVFEFAVMHSLTVVDDPARADFAVTIVSSGGDPHLVVERL